MDNNCNNNFDCCRELVREIKCLKEAVKRCCHAVANQQCNCNCQQQQECNCNGGGGGGLCNAVSQCDTGETTATVIVPAGSCITKIYASYQTQNASDSAGLVTISNEGGTYFCQRFESKPSSKFGIFETTFVQPLCVGDEDATVTVTGPDNTQSVTLTVVYCTDCCGTTAPGATEI